MVFRYETDQQAVYSAHPFLREFFRLLLGTNPESVHESVRAKLAPSLETKPDVKPTDTAILDQYELLIEETLLAGHVQEAFDLYFYGLGGYENLATLGENGRGLRVLERFIPQDDFLRIESQVFLPYGSVLVNDLGLFSLSLGDLARAGRALGNAQRLFDRASNQTDESKTAQNLAHLELMARHFREALKNSESGVLLATEAKNEDQLIFSLAYRATSQFALGDIADAATDFHRATELEGRPLISIRGIQQAECKLLQGDRPGARSQTQNNRELAVTNDWNDELCRCNALLAYLLLPEDPAQAAQYLQEARAFANRSGDVELQLRCFNTACELHLHLGDYPQAIAEAEAGVLLADTCGFGKYSIDLRLALAETLLAAGDARKALQNARNALDRSEEPDCQYAWGKADGLHFCGVAHLRLGEHELARQRLTAALELRERLGHGRIEETRKALELCRK